jgi:hypothetical protein
MNMELQNDHDLLITIHEQVKGIRRDVQDMQDGVKAQLTDHEARIRILERWTWRAIGALVVLQTGLTVYLSLRK